MSTQGLTKYILLISLVLVFSSCKKEPDPLFQLKEVALYPTTAGKDKLKTNEQYVAILHANLFQTALSANDIFEFNNCIESIGDKELAREVIISNFMNKDGVQIPTEEEMDADIETFIIDTYIRFLVRYPTEAEKTYVRQFIQSNPFMTPELVYFSFALSNEYMYY
jgi:hypothetical protein